MDRTGPLMNAVTSPGREEENWTSVSKGAVCPRECEIIAAVDRRIMLKKD